MLGKPVGELRVGEAAEIAKTISEADIYLFAGVTLDTNPAHLNEEYARTTIFKTRIAHGMLTAGLVSAVIGTRLPGPGTIYLEQDLRFLAPVRIGDTVTARVEVAELDPAKNRVVLLTTACNQEGRQVLEGRALVMPPRASRKAN
ncbi:MAG: MaoC family dehydratase [Deltaproteobacteria bacterium]|nr:MaoC family dehydratase [Deltaproteobacteria bacterium]